MKSSNMMCCKIMHYYKVCDISEPHNDNYGIFFTVIEEFNLNRLHYLGRENKVTKLS